MATTSTSSDTAPATQADPLPSKRGEIGFVEGVHAQEEAGNFSSTLNLPPRHPADTDPLPSSNSQSNNNQSTPASTTESSTDPNSKKRILGFCKSSAIGGVQLTTLLVFIAQLLTLCGTIIGWAFTIKALARMASQGHNVPGGMSSSVFVHVVFGVAALAQLLFIERCIFRIRAERYSYIHPGEILPRFASRGPNSGTTIAFAPWSRPPLPTYAAALAQSGAGTGDVEDHIIAAPPPPAYGNTRGSTLLLAGYLRDSLRAQRPPSVHSQSSRHDERPRSYVSRDDEWQEIMDAERARRLEETLAQLERPHPRM